MANPEKTPEKSDKPALTIVTCNRESIVQCQLPGKKNLGGVALGPLLQLMPGRNLVDAALWAEAKKNAVVAALLAEKIAPSKSPECNPEKVGSYILVEGATVSKDNPLASLSETDAIEFVSDLFDIPSAKRFLAEESRGKVVKALRDQIDKIENPAIRKTA